MRLVRRSAPCCHRVNRQAVRPRAARLVPCVRQRDRLVHDRDLKRRDRHGRPKWDFEEGQPLPRSARRPPGRLSRPTRGSHICDAEHLQLWARLYRGLQDRNAGSVPAAPPRRQREIPDEHGDLAGLGTGPATAGNVRERPRKRQLGHSLGHSQGIAPGREPAQATAAAIRCRPPRMWSGARRRIDAGTPERGGPGSPGAPAAREVGRRGDVGRRAVIIQSAVEYAATTARPRLQVAIRGKAE